jgi:thiol-disulfide isomerase/thioredoxin
MRKFLASLALASAAFAVVAQDPKPAEAKKPAEEKKPEEKKPAVRKAKKEPTLKIGDAPPPLTADRWLQGPEHKGYEKGKAYVVEFWATWCGPCIVMMPHMSHLQAEYKDKGVTFIGYSKHDDNNPIEKVEAFVKRRGPKLGYTFCFGEEPDVYNSFMEASGHGGIPCCFVIDRDTKIVFMGHPMYLDLVLPKVVAGQWTLDDVKAIDEIEKEVNAVFGALSGKPETVLKTMADFEKKHPELARAPYFQPARIAAMLKLKKYDDAMLFARNLMTKARKTEDDTLYSTVARSLRSPDGRGQPALMELAVKSADEALKLLGENDSRGLLGVAQTSYFAGNTARGKAYAEKAVAAADIKGKSGTAMQAASSAIEAKDKPTAIALVEQAQKHAKELNKHYVETKARFRAPTDAMILTDAAGYFLDAKDKASGDEYAAKALEASTSQSKPGTKLSLARIYLGAEDKKTGDRYAKEALDEVAESAKPVFMYQLALAYYDAGEKVTARNYAEQSLELAPAALQQQLRSLLRRVLSDPDGKASDK